MKKILFFKTISDAKQRHILLTNEIVEDKAEVDKINAEIVDVNQKLEGIVKKQEELSSTLQSHEVEEKKLREAGRQLVRKSKEIVSAIENSEPNYKAALTKQAKMNEN